MGPATEAGGFTVPEAAGLRGRFQEGRFLRRVARICSIILSELLEASSGPWLEDKHLLVYFDIIFHLCVSVPI